jgi:hypothetical protein
MFCVISTDRKYFHGLCVCFDVLVNNFMAVPSLSGCWYKTGTWHV